MLTELRFSLDDLNKNDLMVYCKENFAPDESCSELDLEEWARLNGWVPQSDLDEAKERIAELEKEIADV